MCLSGQNFLDSSNIRDRLVEVLESMFEYKSENAHKNEVGFMVSTLFEIFTNLH